MEAYRYFFPAGWILGIWGVLLWILFPWNLVPYPGLHHPEIMTGGFFLLFACGFLMTAVPKFTASFGPGVHEQRGAWFLIALLFLSLFSQQKIYFYGAVTALFVFLAVFLFRRFRQRKKNLPDAFLFVGLGLFAGLSGSLTLSLAEFMDVSTPLYNLARLFFLQTYILCLVLGVGSRLIPALTGWAPLPTEVQKLPPRALLFGSLAVLFVLSYVLEAVGFYLVSQLLRALVVSFIVLRLWKIYRLPRHRTLQSWWLWASAWALLLGLWGGLLGVTWRVHVLHVVLVSGLGLMVFMIATRVSLSHGNHGFAAEKTSKALFVGAGLLFFAGLTRLSAGFAPHIYQSHLLYASATWILGLVVWGSVFLPKMIFIKEAHGGNES